jgi:hypothetical protein
MAPSFPAAVVSVEQILPGAHFLGLFAKNFLILFLRLVAGLYPRLPFSQFYLFSWPHTKSL